MVDLAPRPAKAAATPTTSEAVDTIPSLAPSTAARSQPMRAMKCRSVWSNSMIGPFVATIGYHVGGHDSLIWRKI